MLVIDRLRLSLPPGFEHRAESVARLVADELAASPSRREHRLERLEVAAVQIAAGTGDRQVASQVAGAIRQRLAQGDGR